jgi:hypothetical protein
LIIDVEVFTNDIFAAAVFRCSKELVANACADDTNIPGKLVVNFVEHPSILDDVLVHFERGRPGKRRCLEPSNFSAISLRYQARRFTSGIDSRKAQFVAPETVQPVYACCVAKGSKFEV